MFCVRRGSSSLPAFMKTEHHFLIRQAKKSAKRGAFLRRVGNQRFVTHLVVQPASERLSSLPSPFHIQFPPQRTRGHRALPPRLKGLPIPVLHRPTSHLH